MTAARSHTRATPARKPRLSKVTNARDALADFDRGMETYCLTFGQFSLMDALEAILDTTGPADVVVSTWTAGSADLARSEQHLRDQRIRTLRFLVDTSFPQRQPGYAAELVRLFGDDAIRTTRTHAKFAVITNDEWKVAVRTSMNLNENPRLEAIEVSDDPALAGFLLDVVNTIWAEEAVGDYRTKGRPTLDTIASVQPRAGVKMSTGPLTTGQVRAPRPGGPSPRP